MRLTASRAAPYPGGCLLRAKPAAAGCLPSPRSTRPPAHRAALPAAARGKCFALIYRQRRHHAGSGGQAVPTATSTVPPLSFSRCSCFANRRGNDALRGRLRLQVTPRARAAAGWNRGQAEPFRLPTTIPLDPTSPGGKRAAIGFGKSQTRVPRVCSKAVSGQKIDPFRSHQSLCAARANPLQSACRESRIRHQRDSRVVGRKSAGGKHGLEGFRLRDRAAVNGTRRLRSHSPTIPRPWPLRLAAKPPMPHLAPPFEEENFYGLTATMKTCLVGFCCFSLHLLRCNNIFEQFGDLSLLWSGQLRCLSKQLGQFTVGSNNGSCLRHSHNVISSHIVKLSQFDRVFSLRNPSRLLPMQHPGVNDPKFPSDFAQTKSGLVAQIP